jgi:hypothetical protein
MPTLYTWCVILLGYDICKHLDHYIRHLSIDPRVFLSQTSHIGSFSIMFSWGHSRNLDLEDI